MKRVLVITYYWPPMGGSGVQRWVKFSKYLPSLGWQPVIYTPENPETGTLDETLAADIPAEAEIVRHHITEPYGIYRSLMGKKSTTDMKTLTSAPEKKGKAGLALTIRSNFFIPDSRKWWVGTSVRFLKKYLKEHPVDAIITTGPPHSMHLIGQKLAKATGLPWISDFRDPWTKMYWFKHMGLWKCSEKKHFRLEQGVLDSSTVVLTVTPAVQKDMMARTKTPVAMITNGFDTADFGQAPQPDGFFNITHTGIFPGDGNPLALWDALKNMCASEEGFREKLHIRLCGQTDDGVKKALAEAGLMDNVVDLGYQDHNVAVSEQKNASMLVLPLRNDPDYALILPGKLFEYLAARRPILGIGQEDGAMAEVIADAQAGKTCEFTNAEGIRQFIKDSWEAFKRGESAEVSGNIEKYSRKETSAALARLLDSVTARKNG